MKKVLLIIPSNVGTIALTSLYLYEALLTRNDIVTKCVMVHKFSNGYPEFEDCEWCVSETSNQLKKLFAGKKQIRWLKKIKKKFKPDISISTLFSCSTINVLSHNKDFKIGIFHAPHAQFKNKGMVEYIRILLTYKYIYPHLDKLFCVSEEVKMSILNTFRSIKNEKVDVVYNIHDVNRINLLSEELLSEEEAIVFENPVILWCGRFDDNKAPIRMIKAFINSNLPDNAQLLFLGSDTQNMWKEIQYIGYQNGVQNKVHYWGAKLNPYKYIKNAYALVSTSYSEGLPGVLIESLLLHKPIISTNSSKGIWEILSSYEYYDSELKKMYIAKEGVITSNLAEKNKKLDMVDIQNLSFAMSMLFENNSLENSNFLFLKNILAKNNIIKYLLN